MQVQTVIRFDRRESDLLALAHRSVDIAFPTGPGRFADPAFTFPADHPYRRPFPRPNEPTDRRRLDLAVLALEQIADVCKQEADRRFWPATPASRPDALPPGTAGLLAPGFDPYALVAETRAEQARQARTALALARAAGRLAGDPENHTAGSTDEHDRL